MTDDNTYGAKPELKWVPLTKLYVPRKYQRTLEGQASLRNVEFIQRNFNWAEFNTLLVCKLHKDNVKYAIIDGQHRYRAAELLDTIEEVPCVIISPRDVKEQAQTFININSRRLSLTSLQLYRAALATEDSYALMLDRVCKEAGVVIPTWATLISSTPPNAFSATGYTMQLLKTGVYKEENLLWAFKVILGAYPEVKGALRFSLVRALMEWSKKTPSTSVDEMVHMLLMTQIEQIESMAREGRINGGRSMWKSYVEILERLYAAFTKAKKKAS